MNSVQRSALAVSVFGSFITPFMISSVNIALPAIQESFRDSGMNAVLLSWVAMTYLLAAGVSLIPMGRLGDIRGRKKILGYGFGLFALGSLFCGLAPGIYLLLGARCLQGIGGGMIFSTGMAILTSVFPPNRRGRVLGIAVSAVYVGLSTGPFAGGLVTHYLGWRSLFLIIALSGLCPLVLLLLYLKGEWADAAGESYDLPGTLLYVPALVFIIYGFSILPAPTGWLLLVGGCVFLAWFGVRQYRLEAPLFQVGLFLENRVFALSNGAALIHYSATFGLMFLLSLYLQYLKGMDPLLAGTVLVAQPAMMAIFSPVAGRLSDRVEPRLISSVGMGITCAGLLSLSLLTLATPLWLIVAILMVLGFGFAMFSSPNMNAIMGSVERRYLGIASGSAGTMRVFGQMFSMGIATLILSLLVGERTLTPSVYPELLASIRLTFGVFAALCLVGVGASLARGRIHGKE